MAAIVTHVVKVTGEGGDERGEDLRYLLDLCVEWEGDTSSEIRERARARTVFRDADYFHELLADLEERGCVRQNHPPRTGRPGRPEAPTIQVHEALRPSDKSDLSRKSDKSEGRAAPNTETVESIPDLAPATEALT